MTYEEGDWNVQTTWASSSTVTWTYPNVETLQAQLSNERLRRINAVAKHIGVTDVLLREVEELRHELDMLRAALAETLK